MELIIKLSDKLRNMLKSDSKQWDDWNKNFSFREELYLSCVELTKEAYERGSDKALFEVHEILELIYEHEFSMTKLEYVNCEKRPIIYDVSSTLEKAMLSYEYNKISDCELDNIPRNGKSFLIWLKKIISEHSSSVHPLYNEFISNHAEKEHLAFYLAQESSLDPKFDDILALMQIGLDVDSKLELAGNYYDEMGNGVKSKVHSKMFAATLNELGVDQQYLDRNMLPSAKISGNISAALALSRNHYFKAIGYYGVTEFLAPRRFKHVVKAFRRCNISKIGIEYHDLHITVDAIHAQGWFNNVILPALESMPEVGREIAIGAILRLNSSEVYLDELLTVFEAERLAS
ncbi:iron-containing redox enzyme family protein [Moritella marina ATCC 15381]|uniref:Iron-containing redox enzyme family protein n=1 Tax=Moritella marina ATCC 15381 TaxID=1202962 RepID=A0A5J6WG97_MORMI|nr:iron-containing redox enzyme family protein [Moritella marina]QFI37027.1 iron-containing redox enzyme family protein [Moritella marina ATCC 15381]